MTSSSSQIAGKTQIPHAILDDAQRGDAAAVAAEDDRAERSVERVRVDRRQPDRRIGPPLQDQRAASTAAVNVVSASSLT